MKLKNILLLSLSMLVVLPFNAADEQSVDGFEWVDLEDSQNLNDHTHSQEGEKRESEAKEQKPGIFETIKSDIYQTANTLYYMYFYRSGSRADSAISGLN